jgi:hypothetical protein
MILRPSMLIEPQAASVCRTRFTAGRDAPTICASSVWVRPRSTGTPLTLLAAPLLRHAEQQLGNPCGQIEKHQVSRAFGQATDEGTHRAQEHIQQLGPPLHQGD